MEELRLIAIMLPVEIAVFLAPDEVSSGKVVVKNLKLKRQSIVDINDIMEHVLKERVQ